MGIGGPQLFTVSSFLFTDRIEKTFRDLGFLRWNVIARCYELLVLASTWLQRLHHGLGMAASPLDKVIDV